MYKTRLPFLLIFNKTDRQEWGFAKEWMEDFESYQKALKRAGRATSSAVGGVGAGGEEGEGTFMNSLMNSMALVLDEFYGNINVSRPFFCLSPYPLSNVD